MAIEGARGNVDLGDILGGRHLSVPVEQEEKPGTCSPPPGIDLVPFCLTPEVLGSVKSSQWEKLERQENAADLLLITLQGDGTFFSWASILRSLHAVVLQTQIQDAAPRACYNLLRFLYHHNAFLRVHFAAFYSLEEGARSTIADVMNLYKRLASAARAFLRQELIGPHFSFLNQSLIHGLAHGSPPAQPSPYLEPLVESLAQKLLTEDLPIDRTQFPGLFASLAAAHALPSKLTSERIDLFRQLRDYIPLDVEVGPTRATLLLNWERRVVVGETATQGVGEALVRGTEAMEWVENHLPILARLYDRKVDPTLAPHLVLIASDYPPAFHRFVARLGLPVVLYRLCVGESGAHLVRVSPLLKPLFSLELSREEEEALAGNLHLSPDKSLS